MATIPIPFGGQEAAIIHKKHGPRGYEQYQSFKPWLRDEHDYRCVYCLWREQWDPSSLASFGVDHFVPQADRPDLACVYENLCYCCNRCNSSKGHARLPDVLFHEPLIKHLTITESGQAIGRTAEGEFLCDLLRLSHPSRVKWRQIIVELHRQAQDDLVAGRASKQVGLFRYPEDLEDLRELIPPKGNSRPDGLDQSAFMLREAGLLPDFQS